MRNCIFIFCLLLVGLVGCTKKPKVDSNGLTDDIKNLVPDSIMATMKNLGMPIHGGNKPPMLENTYLASPFILVSSNRSSDVVGHLFSDYKVSFTDQDNENLHLTVDYVNGIESGNGIASFIVGEKNKFSVFVTVNSIIWGTNAKMVHVISGELQNKGIKNLYFANFMLDNYGNPNNVWIENGQGRIIKDEDGFSDKQ